MTPIETAPEASLIAEFLSSKEATTLFEALVTEVA
jgi:hypothetical protein